MDDRKKATVIIRVNDRAQLEAARPYLIAAMRGASKRTVGAIITNTGATLATYKNGMWSNYQ